MTIPMKKWVTRKIIYILATSKPKLIIFYLKLEDQVETLVLQEKYEVWALDSFLSFLDS